MADTGLSKEVKDAIITIHKFCINHNGCHGCPLRINDTSYSTKICELSRYLPAYWTDLKIF